MLLILLQNPQQLRFQPNGGNFRNFWTQVVGDIEFCVILLLKINSKHFFSQLRFIFKIMFTFRAMKQFCSHLGQCHRSLQHLLLNEVPNYERASRVRQNTWLQVIHSSQEFLATPATLNLLLRAFQDSDWISPHLSQCITSSLLCPCIHHPNREWL